jgi:hypothetical protein
LCVVGAVTVSGAPSVLVAVMLVSSPVNVDCAAAAVEGVE